MKVFTYEPVPGWRIGDAHGPGYSLVHVEGESCDMVDEKISEPCGRVFTLAETEYPVLPVCPLCGDPVTGTSTASVRVPDPPPGSDLPIDQAVRHVPGSTTYEPCGHVTP